MPTKKVVKKSVSKKAKLTMKTKEQHTRRHFSVTSPLGIALILALLVAAAAAASAGYKAMTAKQADVNEIRMDNVVKRMEITGVVSREQASRGAVARYVLTTSDNTKYELIGMNAGLLERMEKAPNERREKKEEVVYSLEQPEEVERRMEEKKKQAVEETNPARRKTQERVEQTTRTKPMTESELLSKNNKVMETYVGKTVRVFGSQVGNVPKATPKIIKRGKVQPQPELPQFVVKTITVVQ